jgi:ATP-dependent DNA helicase DinG
LPISFEPKPTLEEVLLNPPSGKTVILLPGRGAIEDLYVKYMEKLEAQGTTLICQGLSGGMGRMQAEFVAAKAPAIWLITPWMFEGADMPLGTVDHLLLKTLPFDHPSHAVLSRRAQHYRDPFNEYSLPRLLHRLFRLLRTFSRIKTPAGDVRILDDRVSTKAYGKIVKGYVEQFAGEAKATEEAPPIEKPKAKKAATKKKSKDQLTLF